MWSDTRAYDLVTGGNGFGFTCEIDEAAIVPQLPDVLSRLGCSTAVDAFTALHSFFEGSITGKDMFVQKL